MKAGRIKLAAVAALALAAGAAPATPQLFEIDAWGLRKARYMEALMFGRGPLGGPFALVDQTGARRTLGDFRGSLVLLYFGYTFCPDVCPTDLLALRQALELLGPGGAAVRIVFVSVDPERDTPAHLASYLAHFDPRIVGLTGTVEEVRRVADAYKAYFGKVQLKGSDGYLVDHSTAIYLLGRDGSYLGNFPGVAGAERLAATLREFL